MPSTTDVVLASPAAKRIRLENGPLPSRKLQRRHGESRLFAPYRTVGLVSPTSVPFTSVPLGKTTFQISTSVGTAIQTYDLAKGLNLVFITRPQTPAAITATLAWKQFIFAAWGGSDYGSTGIWIFQRGKKVAELDIPASQVEAILDLRIFGSWIVGVSASSVLIWNSGTLEHYTRVQAIPGSAFTGALATVPTLLNKVLLGKDDGSVELWNVATGKLVHMILPESADRGAVTVLEPAPALGTVAIGYSDGTIAIHDVLEDKPLLQLYLGSVAAASLPVTTIAFRSDGLGAGDDGRSPGVMATASRLSGDIVLWDLNQGGRKAGTLRGAHAAPSKGSSGGVSKIEFLSGQAVLVSSGLDNRLSTWIFDETPFSPIPRPLHTRGGHGASVSKLHFLPSASDGSDMSGKWLLASSHDRSLWGWSLRRDGQSTELSQGAIRSKARKSGIMASEGKDFIEQLKAPPITGMACSLNRDGGMGAIPGKLPMWQTGGIGKSQSQRDAESSGMTGWESVVTSHEQDSKARTWFWGRKRAGRWAFETGDKTPVASVAVSPCGSFAVIGSESGGIDTYNLQSGMHRQRFPSRLTPQQAKQLKIKLEKDHDESMDLETETGREHYYRGMGRHSAAVTGLAVDNLNKTLISCGQDSKVKFWDFRTGALQHELNWTRYGAIASVRLHRSSELAAFSCSDGAVRVVDASTRKLVRELRISRDADSPLHKASFADLTFSSDGRWIIAATLAYIAVWDLPTGHLIDLSKLPSAITAISFSPTAEYLATASSTSVGIDIWTNNVLYTHIPTRHVSESEVAAIINSAATTAPNASGSTAAQALPSSAQDDSPETDASDDASDDGLPLLGTDDSDQLAASLLRLSLEPRSKSQNLLHLDTIRARNAPIAPPSKPEKAPFFLPALHNPLTGAALPPQLPSPLPAAEAAEQRAAADVHALAAERSRISRMDRDNTLLRPFTTLLHSAAAAAAAVAMDGDVASNEAHAEVVRCLRSLSPAAADVEIRSLARAGAGGGGVNELEAFVGLLCWVLRSRRDFELGQVWMSVFLRVHGDGVVQDRRVREAVARWRGLLGEERRRVQGLVDYCGGMVGYLRAARV